MSIVTYTQAVRKNSKVLIFAHGESGSGKTLSALIMARGLVGPAGKIFGLDTETGRMLVYADDPRIGGFLHGELTPPFSPERYTQAILDAEAAGADVLVIDSLSHEWSDLGGVLELADKNGKKGLQKWADPKTRHKKFVKAMLRTRLHIIGCMRAKEKFREETENGQKKLISDGYVPEQDKRLKYEATIQFYFTNEARGVPVVEKVPGMLAHCFTKKPVTTETGRMISEWAAGGAAIDHEFESLRQAGEDAAEGGEGALRAWWDSPAVKPHKARLQPFMDNMKSIAAEADRAANDQALAEQDGSGLSDPFGQDAGGAAPSPHAPPAAGTPPANDPPPGITGTFVVAFPNSQPKEYGRLADWSKVIVTSMQRINDAAVLESFWSLNAQEVEGINAVDGPTAESVRRAYDAAKKRLAAPSDLAL